jgi:hypothetical protein
MMYTLNIATSDNKSFLLDLSLPINSLDSIAVNNSDCYWTAHGTAPLTLQGGPCGTKVIGDGYIDDTANLLLCDTNSTYGIELYSFIGATGFFFNSSGNGYLAAGFANGVAAGNIFWTRQ